MTDYNLDAMCTQGNLADDLVSAGQFDDAEAVLQNLLEEMQKSGYVDSTLIAKIVLSLLRCRVMAQDFTKAHELWTRDLETEKSLEAAGIYFLERAQTDPHDLMLYYSISALLHSLSQGSKADALAAVNRYMTIICEYSQEREPDMLVPALSNWHHYLLEIYDGKPTDEALAAFSKVLSASGAKIPGNAQTTFVEPSKWDPSKWQKIDKVVGAADSPWKKIFGVFLGMGKKSQS